MDMLSLYVLTHLSLANWQALVSAMSIIFQVDFASSKGYYSTKEVKICKGGCSLLILYFCLKI